MSSGTRDVPALPSIALARRIVSFTDEVALGLPGPGPKLTVSAAAGWSAPDAAGDLLKDGGGKRPAAATSTHRAGDQREPPALVAGDDPPGARGPGQPAWARRARRRGMPWSGHGVSPSCTRLSSSGESTRAPFRCQRARDHAETECDRT